VSLAVAVIVAASACSVPAPESAAQRSLPYADFDARSGPYGWRVLAAAGCTDAAVSLLADYAQGHAGRQSPSEQRELAFHIGQVLALAGREPEALAPFERAQGTDAPLEWSTYVRATLAFLRRDAAALAAARDAYASLAPGSVRLRIIDGFVACPKESYARAVHCRM
jgi:hypothetical protein